MVALPSAPQIDSRRFEEITRDWRDRAELIHGDIYVIPPSSFRHQAVGASGHRPSPFRSERL
jgi:hypothetical protein